MTQISAHMDHLASKAALKSSIAVGEPMGANKADKIDAMQAHQSQKTEKMDMHQNAQEMKQVRFEKADHHAMEVVKQTMKANHGAMTDKIQKHDAMAQYKGNAPSDTSAKSVVKEIMISIGQQLGAADANGGGAEALEAILNEARQGFESGMDDAKSQLMSMGMMSPEIKGDLQKVVNGVLSGLGKLEEKYSGDEASTDYTLPGGPVEDEYTLPVETADDTDQDLV